MIGAKDDGESTPPLEPEIDVIASDKNLKTIRLRGDTPQPRQVPGVVIKGIGVESRAGDGNG